MRKLLIENMAEVGGVIALTGIESPNKRAKMDSGLTATNFDESKFARYYRTDAASSPTSSHSSPVASDSSTFYSYPYTFPSNSFSSYAYPCGQSDTTALYTYPASYGVHYNTLNGFSSEFSSATGMHTCAWLFLDFSAYRLMRYLRYHKYFSCRTQFHCKKGNLLKNIMFCA